MNGTLKKYNIFSLLILAEDETGSPSSWLNEQLAFILQSPTHVIINAYALRTMTPKIIESFVFFEHELTSKNKLLQFIYFPPELKLISPLVQSLKFPNTFANAIAAFSSSNTQVTSGKIHFVKAFVDATIRVIFIQGKTLSQRGKITLKQVNHEKLFGPISGVVKVASQEFPYDIIISFTETCYLKLISNMIGEEQLSITDKNRDGATEILNIIYGQAKIVLNQDNASIAPQIPVLHSGFDYHREDCNIVCIPFSSDCGDFNIEVRTPKDADMKKFFAQ